MSDAADPIAALRRLAEVRARKEWKRGVAKNSDPQRLQQWLARCRGEYQGLLTTHPGPLYHGAQNVWLSAIGIIRAACRRRGIPER